MEQGGEPGAAQDPQVKTEPTLKAAAEVRDELEVKDEPLGEGATAVTKDEADEVPDAAMLVEDTQPELRKRKKRGSKKAAAAEAAQRLAGGSLKEEHQKAAPPPSGKRTDIPDVRQRAKKRRSGGSAVTYYLSSWLFLRFLGLLYVVAFLSAWVQIHGLVGSEGISPMTEFITRLRSAVVTDTSFLTHPTVFWLNDSDWMIHAVCATGTGAAVMLLLDMAPAVAAFLCWFLFLSITVAGQTFFAAQWDYLLLETGFLAIFFSSFHVQLKPFSRNPRDFHPPEPILWLFRLLLFRINFARGLQELLGKDKTWRTLSAFAYNFETQQAPTALSWYAHQLPNIFHQGLVFWVLTVEIGIVFLIVGPQLFRRTACLYIILLQMFYLATGNFGTYHWNVIALCLLLLDDGLFPGTFKRICSVRKTKIKAAQEAANLQWASGVRKPPAQLKKQKMRSSKPRAWHKRLSMLLAVFVIVMTTIPLTTVTQGTVTTPKPLLDVYKKIYPFKLVNLYGPFNRVQKERFELVLQGSLDAQTWTDYHFLYKPDNNIWRAPAYLSPHISRLEYQLWIAAQGEYQQEVWISRLLHRILEDSPAVVSLFKKEPFPEVPEYIRAVRYRFEFTTSEQAELLDGAWWISEFFDIYTPSFSQTVHSMSSRRKNLRARLNKGMRLA